MTILPSPSSTRRLADRRAPLPNNNKAINQNQRTISRNPPLLLDLQSRRLADAHDLPQHLLWLLVAGGVEVEHALDLARLGHVVAAAEDAEHGARKVAQTAQGPDRLCVCARAHEFVCRTSDFVCCTVLLR